MKIANKLAHRVTEGQGEGVAWCIAFFLLGYIAAKVFSPAIVLWCFPVA